MGKHRKEHCAWEEKDSGAVEEPPCLDCAQDEPPRSPENPERLQRMFPQQPPEHVGHWLDVVEKRPQSLDRIDQETVDNRAHGQVQLTRRAGEGWATDIRRDRLQ